MRGVCDLLVRKLDRQTHQMVAKIPGRAKCLLLVVFDFVILLGCNIPLPNNPSSRQPLDVIWEKYMIEARGGSVWLDQESKPLTIREGKSFQNLGQKLGQKEEPKSILIGDPYRIFVSRHVEGIFGNGGWMIVGGLLGRLRGGEQIVDLYGKAIVWTSPHIPGGVFHGGPPMTESFEFILVRRVEGQADATILRRWQVNSEDVVLDRYGFSEVTGMLTYDHISQTALISITGLSKPVEERLDVLHIRAAK